jgi:acyl-CoA thioesterase-1
MSRENLVIKAIYKTAPILFAVLLAVSLAIIGSQYASAKTTNKQLEIAFLGDSITAGYGLNPGEAFPELITKMLAEKGTTITLINAGVSGDTTSGGLARLNWSIPDTVDGVVVELGANDAFRGIPVEQIKQNLESIITGLKDRGIDVLLAGMLSPPNMGVQYETAFNAIYPDLAEKYDLLFYDFILDGVAAEPALNQIDGIHPNLEGSKVIAENFMPIVEQFIARLGG